MRSLDQDFRILRERADCRQWLIKLVRNARRELPNRGQLGSMNEFILGIAQLLVRIDQGLGTLRNLMLQLDIGARKRLLAGELKANGSPPL